MEHITTGAAIAILIGAVGVMLKHVQNSEKHPKEKSHKHLIDAKFCEERSGRIEQKIDLHHEAAKERHGAIISELGIIKKLIINGGKKK